MSIYGMIARDNMIASESSHTFNKMCKEINTKSFSYEQFIEYYNLYFSQAGINSLRFDYEKYGLALLDIVVICKNKQEMSDYNKKRLEISKFVVLFRDMLDKNRIINPVALYEVLKSKRLGNS